MVADAKTEMAQSVTGSEVMVRWKGAGIDVSFQRFNQGIEPRVNNRAAIEVDDPV